MALSLQSFTEEQEETGNGTPIKYLPLHHVYSATSPCISASGSSMSKKVKARKLVETFGSDSDMADSKPSELRVYQRKKNRSGSGCVKRISFYDRLIKQVGSEMNPREIGGNEGLICKEEKLLDVEIEECLDLGENGRTDGNVKKEKKEKKNYELLSLSSGSEFIQNMGSSGRRGRHALKKCSYSTDGQNPVKKGSGSVSVKKWVMLSFEDVDPMTFIGFACKVYWPLDDEWYAGSVTSYNPETKQHQVKYDDGDREDMILSGEKIKFCISQEEIQRLNFKCSYPNTERKPLDYDEMIALAASFDDCDELEPGDIIWAKLTGHAMWPAVIMDETHVLARKGLEPVLGERSITVQFFGTHDFARINIKQVISFVRGLLSSFHLKCKQSRFHRSLEEARRYLREQKLPDRMVRLQNGIGSDDSESGSGEEDETSGSGDNDIGDESTKGAIESITSCPFEIGDLRVISLGKIVKDSEYFHNERYIWPEGYIAERKFMSTTDSSTRSTYNMEVLRDPKSKAWPLFRVTLDNDEQINGSTPAACWKKVYARMKIERNNLSNGFHAESGRRLQKSGSHMFGFSNQHVSKLIQNLPNSRLCTKYFGSKFASGSYWDLPEGYRPVRVDWKDLDRCNVCHMDEEYENNLFLQCDKCRMMVHARCYGELEPLNGLWLCNLCRPGAPRSPPLCCLCPVTGGAVKPTTDGRWAHLTCAMWIPETCLLDVQRMEPIDGLNRISKDRWKLLCSICGVPYGACIQCSNSTCRVAYHPLCARAAGLCVELEDEDKLHLMSIDEDDEQCIRLLSFCKKHRQPSAERSSADVEVGQSIRHCSSYSPPSNQSGCARSEPYDFFARRGRKEPEALAAASVKRLYVENRPYLVSGYRQNGSLGEVPSCNELVLTTLSKSLQKSETSQLASPKSFLSMAEKYKYMRDSFRKRLAFGKSAIHGFGIFAKNPHRAGDMVIEYTGELVRPSIADMREHLIYNSLVGAGTYMFRIDDEHVIDATRAGSIAHLINHSCEPNCYSRGISINGDEHIIIFAKRDITRWEELTYDYRFFSIDEQLACYCGFPRCRGVVNDIEAEEQMAKLRVPRRELIDWRTE